MPLKHPHQVRISLRTYLFEKVLRLYGCSNHAHWECLRTYLFEKVLRHGNHHDDHCKTSEDLPV